MVILYHITEKNATKNGEFPYKRAGFPGADGGGAPLCLHPLRMAADGAQETADLWRCLRGQQANLKTNSDIYFD
jgi:hypothetical protein